MYKVVVLDHSFSNIDIERQILEPIGAKIYEYQCNDPNEAVELVKDADVVLVTNYKTLTRETINKLQKCKLIVKHGIGPDIIDVEAASEKGIMVANLPDYCLNEVSEHAISLTYAIGRKLYEADRRTREILDHKLFELRPIKAYYNSTFGIIGFGRIGRITARNLSSTAGEIIFYDPFFNNNYSVNNKVCTKVSLDNLYKRSDYIIIHAPYTKSNYHIINKNAFNKMEKKPYIINVGRGELINNKDLVEAINNEIVSGAALDVVEGMPPIAPDDPLLKCKNIYFTPHCAWYSEESYKRIQTHAANEVKRVLLGGKPKSWFNKKDFE